MRHVLADLADQRGARRFDRTLAQRQRRQRGDVGRILVCHQVGAVGGQLEELVVLGDEIGLAVDFENAAQLAIGGDVDRHHAFSGDAGRGLAGLVAQLDAQNFFGLVHVAAGFGQRLLAFHHRRVGLLAQFLDHACGNFRHCFTPESNRTCQPQRAQRSRETSDLLCVPVISVAKYLPYSAASSTSTNSSSPASCCTTSLIDWFLPSRMASATPRAYRRMARRSRHCRESRS